MVDNSDQLKDSILCNILKYMLKKYEWYDEDEDNLFVRLKLTELINKNYKTPNNCILSISSYMHGLENQDKFKKFQMVVYKLNRQLRKGIDITCDIDLVISSTYDDSFVVYRGIIIQHNAKIGDILENNGYLFTTLQKGFAIEFIATNYDDCYLYKDKKDFNCCDFDINKAKPNYKGTLFKINIPPNTPFFNRSYLNEFPLYVKTEILFKCGYKLKVIDKKIKSTMFGHKITYTKLTCDLLV